MKNQQKNSFVEQSGTSQTGVNTTPLQVENVQYNVTVGKVVSKVGLASKIFTICHLALQRYWHGEWERQRRNL
jgi:hypothetical protein